MLGVEEGIRALLAHALGWYTVPGWDILNRAGLPLIGSALLVSIGILRRVCRVKLYEQSNKTSVVHRGSNDRGEHAGRFQSAGMERGPALGGRALGGRALGMTRFDQLSTSYEELLAIRG